MTDLNTDTGDVADQAPDDSALSRMIDPKAFQAPAQEKETFDGTAHGIGQAAEELTKSREKPAPKIRQRRMPDDGPKTFKDAREAAPWLSTTRKIDRVAERIERTGASTNNRDAWVAGNIVRQEMDDAAEPKPIEYVGKDKRETVTAREAAADLARYRTETAPAEEEAKAEQRKLLAELGAADLIAEQAQPEATEQPVEQPQPVQSEQPQHDPVEQHRQQAAQYLQVAQQYAGLTQAEHLAAAQINQALAIHRNEFADVQSYEDAARLPADRQARFMGQQQALRTAAEQFQNLSAQRQLTQHQIEAARTAEQNQAFQRYRAEQNAAVEKAIPELAPNADPAQQYAFTTAARGLVEKHLGITPQNARSLSPEIQRALHHSGFAEIIAKAVRWDHAQQRVAEARPVPAPAPQRPGVSQPKGARQSAEAASLADRIDRFRQGSEKQLRAAAAAIAAGRKARSR